MHFCFCNSCSLLCVANRVPRILSPILCTGL
nr:MAG TPA: hypothetical protein [Microviridae sp.]